ncbi:MAG: translation initiation factor IF-2 [Lachnospiraceae bacterium]|nr:translation initiation factor IF-2 [Lachnospiraceae bacterium]
MRVSDLAKELEMQSKEVIAILEANGIEGKKAASGVDEEQAKLVRAKAAKGAAKEEPKAKEVKPETKKEAPKAKENKEANKQADASKKKNVSMVFNSQYTGNGAQQQRHTPQQGGRPQAPAGRNNGARTGIIKPRVAPTQVSNDGVRPDPYKGTNGVKQANEKVAEKPQQNTKQNVSNTVAPAADSKPSIGIKVIGRENVNTNQGKPQQNNRPNNRQNNGQNTQRPQGQNRPNQNANQNRPGMNNNRPGQNNNAPSAMNQTPAKGNGKPGKKGKKDREEKSGKAENFINLEKQTRNKVSKPKEKNETEIRSVAIPERIVIRDLAERMHVSASDIVKKLFLKGNMVTPNHEIDFETAEEIALEYNCIIEKEEKVDVIAELLAEEEEDTSKMVKRPPVVCVMGHVDHGKTSLLDAIRNTNVTARESGGITQHIGAYTVNVGDEKITFLDTPGHEAFTAMRMRGANSTDIAILVVAADDGVMPQTVEAINHAKAAKIEIIVAINKIDKPGANIDRVKQELSEYELIPEDWGGSTVFCPVSAKSGEGIDNLLDMLLLTAEVLELKANPKRNARGLVIEARLDKGRGVVATALVQKGTLHAGDFVSAGASYGRVRAMNDDKGRKLKDAGPSTPVEILGLSEAPNAGEIFIVHDSEKEARSYAETFVSENKNRLIEETKAKMSLDDLFSKIQSGKLKELDLIVKADVQGSVEAVKQSLEKLTNDEVVVKVIHSGVGAINESDVVLASASSAIIIGFNVRPDAAAKSTADHEGVDIRLYSVIYAAIEDVEAAMKGMLDPIYEEKIIGHAEVRQIFKASGVGNIAGSYVLDGNFQRDCKVRITRDDEQIFEGNLASLKRFKDDVKEVKAGFECGLVFEDFDQIAEGDQIEAYIMVEVPR